MGTRVSQAASAVSRAGTSWSMRRPVSAETLTRGAQVTRTELAVDLPLQVVAPVLVDQVPLVEGEHQRPAGLDHHRDDALVLLG